MFKSLLQNVQILAANIGNLSETKKDLADFFYIFKENLSITAFHRDGPEVNIESDQISFFRIIIWRNEE